MDGASAAALPACSPRKLPAALRRAIVNGEVAPHPPSPMANGPLFAVSHALAATLSAAGSVAWKWVHDFKNTSLVRFARRWRKVRARIASLSKLRRRQTHSSQPNRCIPYSAILSARRPLSPSSQHYTGTLPTHTLTGSLRACMSSHHTVRNPSPPSSLPLLFVPPPSSSSPLHAPSSSTSPSQVPYKLHGLGCWPFGDATFGVWLGALSHTSRLNLTLVNAPLNVLHHPLPTLAHGAFGNSSIVLHGLKDASHDR